MINYQSHPLEELQWAKETSLSMSFRVRIQTSGAGIMLLYIHTVPLSYSELGVPIYHFIYCLYVTAQVNQDKLVLVTTFTSSKH